MLLQLLLATLWGGSRALDTRYRLQVQREVRVQEGLCVLVPCSFSYPRDGWDDSTPALGYWYKDSGVSMASDYVVAVNNQKKWVHWSTRDRFQLVGDPQSMSCSLLIKEAKREDSGQYYFRVERGSKVKFNYKNFEFSLEVTDAPRNLEISISLNSAAVEPQTRGSELSHLDARQGQALRLLCEAESLPPAILSWTLGGRVLSWSQPWGPRGLALELPSLKAGDSGIYTCTAEHRLGSLSRTLELSVQYAPQNLTVTVTRGSSTVLEDLRNGDTLEVLEGQRLRLHCQAQSHPAARLSWEQGDRMLSSPQPLGVLELPGVGKEQEGELTCLAQNELGSLSISLGLSVVSAPHLQGPSCSWEDEVLCCSCSSRAWPAPTLRWQLGNQTLEVTSNDTVQVTISSGGPWANGTLSLHRELGAGLRLSCEARNTYGERSTGVLLIPDEKGLPSKTFSHGIFLGMGVTTFLFLCLILVLVKTLRRKGSLAEKDRLSRRSTILDYVNVFPGAGALARNRKAKPSSPSMPPPPSAPPSAPSPEAQNQQKEHHYVPHGPLGPGPSTQAAEPGSPDEVQYATLNFPGLRPWEAQQPRVSHADYEAIKFH
ncbi:sialic acid-binding Ig-like lectin 10 isoform X2 [Erinaceus europaeus]|uniref:Sialic acid-binding Ig-like lectin 10 isoform X2 n=1 Tax=Erinaceus europaeus TaxID=9365 RepID=A0ABM3W451_ERIEU|nr:sialic acid-binding Ig-like lectin 10 isoform X2 [Erinaceus europaeus]